MSLLFSMLGAKRKAQLAPVLQGLGKSWRVFKQDQCELQRTERAKHNWTFFITHFAPYNPPVKNPDSFIYTGCTLYQQWGNCENYFTYITQVESVQKSQLHRMVFLRLTLSKLVQSTRGCFLCVDVFFFHLTCMNILAFTFSSGLGKAAQISLLGTQGLWEKWSISSSGLYRPLHGGSSVQEGPLGAAAS